jgi:hypothetical protein
MGEKLARNAFEGSVPTAEKTIEKPVLPRKPSTRVLILPWKGCRRGGYRDCIPVQALYLGKKGGTAGGFPSSKLRHGSHNCVREKWGLTSQSCHIAKTSSTCARKLIP